MTPRDAARTRRLGLFALLGTLLLLAVVAGPQGVTGGAEDPRMSTYVSGSGGARALFLVLEELGVGPERNRVPWTRGAPPGVFVVLAPTREPDSAAVAAVRGWVEDGGTLVVAPGSPDGALARILELDPTAEAPVARTLGEGRILHWPDPDPLRNHALRDDPDPLVPAVTALLGALDEAGPGLRFDEYHHGYRGEGSPARALADFLFGNPWGRWLVQGIFAVLLLLVLFGRRFGAPLPRSRPRARSPLEHAEALAAVYRKAEARGTARRSLLAGLSRRVGTRIPPAESLELPPGLAPFPAAAELEAAWRTPGDEGLVALCAAMDRLESQIRSSRAPRPK
jgi:hypothetical protein